MRILFVVADPLTPVRVRPRNLVRALGQAGHEVVVVMPGLAKTGRDDQWHLPGAAAVHTPVILRRGRRLASLAQGFFTPWPFQACYGWHPGMDRYLSALVASAARAGQPFAVAHVEHLRGARYAVGLVRRLPVLWDSVDCISLLLEQAWRKSRSNKGRVMAAVDLHRTRRCEGRLVWQFAAVTVTGARDREALLRLARAAYRAAPPIPDELPAAGSGAPNVMVVRNGVDLEAFAPNGSRDDNTIIFSGKLSYHANVTAALELVERIMPLVWRERPEVRVILAGAEPVAAVRALVRRHPERVQVTGYVSDLAAPLRRASVAVAPLLYSVGVQNKVLEAMATATPVVASPAAAEALDAEPGREILVADDRISFATAVLSLLADRDCAERLGWAGRRYVERHHQWSDAAAALVRLYEVARIGGQPARRPAES